MKSAFILLLAALLLPSVTCTASAQVPEAWPEGELAYDGMTTLADFGYRRIDTAPNFQARDWIAEELEAMGYEVERQSFTTAECANCENIVVTINGSLNEEWMVIGAHHDAICYSPAPVTGATYPGCTSSGAYDDGTGSGALLEIARTLATWNGTPLHTWKLGWWDYEEWQGSGSAEGGGMGSLHFVDSIPNGTNVTYLNLDMFALNWPVPTPAASQASGCDEDYWTLYMFTSPISDWSYYEDRGLEVTETMRADAAWLQQHLTQVNDERGHPTEWVRVIDDTKGNSDHYNFIMAGHAATWLRGQHQYILEEGDTCEQTPKHAQTDSITTLNRLAGGRTNVEAGLQTGLDVIATVAWWDWSAGVNFSKETSPDHVDESRGIVSPFGVLGSATWIVVAATLVRKTPPEN